eukprot:scaffold250_cov110-Isochrysis_galbana.AAC.20
MLVRPALEARRRRRAYTYEVGEKAIGVSAVGITCVPWIPKCSAMLLRRYSSCRAVSHVSHPRPAMAGERGDGAARKWCRARLSRGAPGRSSP